MFSINWPTKSLGKTNSEEITALIRRDHEPIKKLILILKDSEVGIAKKRPAYTEFEHLLSQHAKAEEKSLYVHMKSEDDLKIEGLEGDTEHNIADTLMKEIDGISNDENLWSAKVKVLAELVDHHVKEEENEVLKQVIKEFDVNTRIEIGKEYSELLSHFRAEQNGQSKHKSFFDNINGKVGVPILLYFLGVPGFFVILLWAFFFRGK